MLFDQNEMKKAQCFLRPIDDALPRGARAAGLATKLVHLIKFKEHTSGCLATKEAEMCSACG